MNAPPTPDAPKTADAPSPLMGLGPACLSGLGIEIALSILHGQILSALPLPVLWAWGALLSGALIGIGRWIGGCGLVFSLLSLGALAYIQGHVDLSSFAPLIRTTNIKTLHLPMRAVVFALIWLSVVASLGALLGDSCLKVIKYRKISFILLGLATLSGAAPFFIHA